MGGQWGLLQQNYIKKKQQKSNNNNYLLPLELRLPFRSQRKPEFHTRERDTKILQSLINTNKGYGYCAAWYSRRLFQPVTISENDPLPHYGLGLNIYVQWTSPIRRLSDLQVHAMIKRYLRRRRINEYYIKNGFDIPKEITPMDLGCYLPYNKENHKEEKKL